LDVFFDHGLLWTAPDALGAVKLRAGSPELGPHLLEVVGESGTGPFDEGCR
jgi:hypothetical protein